MRSENLISLISDIQIHAQQLGSQKDIEHLILLPLSWHGLLSYHSVIENIVDFPRRFQRYASEQTSVAECKPFENDLFEIFRCLASHLMAETIGKALLHRVVAAFQEARFDLLVCFSFPELTQDPCRTQCMFEYRKTSAFPYTKYDIEKIEAIIHDVETLYRWQKRSQTVPWSHSVDEPNKRTVTLDEIGRLSRTFGYEECHISITQGCLSDLEQLAKTHQRLQHVLAADILGWTPLHYAVAYHHEKIVRDHTIILEKKKERLPRDVAGRTPMHDAVMHGCLAKSFRRTFVFEEWAEKDRCGMTPLHYADGFGNVEVIEFLKVRGEYRFFEAPWRDITGRTVYHWAAIGGKVDMLKILRTIKWNFMIGDQNGDTPLHYAARYGRFEAVKYLVFMERDHLLTKNKKDKTAEEECRFMTNSGIQTLLEQARVASLFDAEWDLFMWLLQWDY